MAAEGPFRALSLDLWFTTVYHEADFDESWEAARVDVLEHRLRRRGRHVPRSEVASALEASRRSMEANGRDLVALDPSDLLADVARRLEAEVSGDVEEAVEAFSSAGLREVPPSTNPEAAQLVRELARRGVPSVLLTNSGRRASSWVRFLSENDRPHFAEVVSSADLGVRKPDPRMFREAARRIDVPLPKLFHVGDRWELDVEGAVAAGCGAALYTGLWHRYPAGMYPATQRPASLPSGVRVVERLDELLDPSLWERASLRPTA